MSHAQHLARLASAAAGPLVKVCGLTRPEDAALAASLGAWALGFVLAPSPRRVTPEQACALAAAGKAACAGYPPGRPSLLAVGVFVDASPEEIAAIAVRAGLDAVQLHGPKPGAAAVRAALEESAADALIIQAIPVPAGAAAGSEVRAAVRAAGGGADLLLFDTRVDGKFGGTGASFPWALAREAAGETPFLVAGGLGPGNAAAALAAAGAVGVDVSSGVEESPGVKDPDLLRALFAALGSAYLTGGGRAAPPVSEERSSEGTTP